MSPFNLADLFSPRIWSSLIRSTEGTEGTEGIMTTWLGKALVSFSPRISSTYPPKRGSALVTCSYHFIFTTKWGSISYNGLCNNDPPTPLHQIGLRDQHYFYFLNPHNLLRSFAQHLSFVQVATCICHNCLSVCVGIGNCGIWHVTLALWTIR